MFANDLGTLLAQMEYDLLLRLVSVVQQTADHVALHCPIHRPPREVRGLTVLDDETSNGCPTPAPGSSAAWQWIKPTRSNDEKEEMFVVSRHELIRVLAWNFGDLISSRARPIRFFWTDTDVFQFSLPISDTDIFVLLKQYLFCLMKQNNPSWSYFAFSQTFSNYSWKTLQCIFFFRPHKQSK